MMTQALALLEFQGAATGLAAVDRMLKQAPIALLRCGTVHPGRYLALVGGTVASTAEAYSTGCEMSGLVDEVFLPDPHPGLVAAARGVRVTPVGEAVCVCEVSTAPGMLRAVDAVLKSVPVGLVEVRLADDLGGRSLAIFDGVLPDVMEVLAVMAQGMGGGAELLATSLLPRIEDTLRDVLAGGTRFDRCEEWTPAGAEMLVRED